MIGMSIIVVGLGQDMHGDDEIGLQIVRSWMQDRAGFHSHQEIQVAILESPGVNLLGAIAGLDAAVLVAAVRSGAPAGIVQVYQDEELWALEESGGLPGAWGAAETLSLGRQLVPEDLPGKLMLIAIEGAAFRLGEGLSPAVAAAIPGALEEIDRIVDGLLKEEKRFKQLTQRWGRKLSQFLRKAA